jgi:hypothetical protein
MVRSFRPSEIEGEVLSRIESKNSNVSALKIARPILSRFIEFSDDREFSLDEPVEIRDELYSFYEKQSEHYSKIENQHLMPLKEMLRLLQKRATGKEELNVRMVRDTLKSSYFSDQDEYRFDILDDQILTKKQVTKLRNKFDEEKRFVVELFLQTTAKIGAIAALKHQNFPSSETDNLRIDFRQKYIPQSGVQPLEGERSRSVSIEENLAQLYFGSFFEEEGYIFGESPEEAHRYLRRVFGEMDSDLEFSVKPRRLRSTGAYLKLEEKTSEELRKIMGLESKDKIQRLKQVKKKSEEV